MSKTLHRNLQAKMSALKGPEWDSSDEEEDVVSKSSGRQSKADRKRSKRAQKQTEQSSLKMDDGVSDDEEDEEGSSKKKSTQKKLEKPTVLYVGHLPVELEERDLRTFLSQFGDVIHSRISRSLQTGHSRGYGFVQFADPETSKIVAETLQGYFLGKKRLVCHLIDKPDDGLFFDTDRLIAQRKNDLQVERKRRRENLGNASKMKEITTRLVQREKKKRKKLQALGIDYDFPGYAGSLAAQTDKENSEEPEMTTPKSDKKKKDKKRSDSVSSVGSANSSSSASKKSKRKDSIGSTGSSSSKSKRKDSMGSVGSNSSSSGKKKEKKRRHSEGGASDKAGKSKVAAASTPTSSSKKKKSKKSRKSL